MKLTRASITNDRAAFEAAGYRLPAFDYDAVRANTESRPEWVHFGAGNIFRAFQANVMQNLLNSGAVDTGLIAVEGYDYEIIEKSYRPHDNLSILATLKADSTVEKTVVGSIVESLILDRGNETDFTRLKEIFTSSTLKMASFTITEKGYAVTDASGHTPEAIKSDFDAGPEGTNSYLGKVFSLLYARYQAGRLPIAMVSMDNCSHNGDKLKAAAEAFAGAWTEKGLAEKGFLDYIRDPGSVSFPWSMIDKITPRPDARVEEMLNRDSIEGLEPIVTSKKTWVAPFVNAEECQYLVIEDLFPNGKLPLDREGIIYTDRITVDKVEKMKVCTCLNPLHTTLAVFGCLLGYTLISEEMKNPLLKKFVEQIGYVEGLPVVVNPGILDPKRFIDEVVNTRIPNPFMPDTPQRIACDTSQKLPIRFGETIKAYDASASLDVNNLKYIPLVFAGWLRYLMAVDDEGNAFEPSPDPLLASSQEYVSGFSLGKIPDDLSGLDALLSNDKIFGVDLVKIGMADTVKKDFSMLCAGTGAVKNTLEAFLA
ncbi:MAG: mannitol dehydrogenase family protein [Lachnospiraceae bacterium]|nr:mannitol dehydrogenase family protein [Lachnospiraceae bacterium]